MFSRQSFKLIGNVRRVNSEFSELEVIDGQPVPTNLYASGFLLFSADGRLLEEMSLEREQMDGVFRDVYHYDPDGRLIERIEYEFNGDITGKTIFDTTDGGFRIEEHWYVTLSGSYQPSSKLIFDQNNIFLHGVRLEPTGPVELPLDYFRSGREEEIVSSVADSSIVEIRRYDKNDQLSLRTLTRYDLQGTRKEFSCFEPDGTMYLRDEFEHEYDSTGNWISEVQSHWVIGWGEFRLVPSTTTIRQIEYFD